MNPVKLAATLIPVSLLGSCVYMPDILPDMPYSGSLKTETAAPAPKPKSSGFFGQKSPLLQVQQQPTPKTPDVPATTPPPTIPAATALPPGTTPAPTAAAIPGAAVQPVPQVVQAPPPAVKPATTPASTTITSGSSKVQPVIAPQPKAVQAPKVTQKPKVTTPKPVSAAAPAATAKQAPKAPATTPAPAAKPEVKAVDTPPVASRVPGDPFRVYNPYEPSKTILIKGANGQPFPSGKKLKIQGTDKYFIVP